MSRETVLFVMPAYNEAKNIEGNIKSWIPIVKSIIGSKLLIIDDGSTDATLRILKRLENKWRVLKVINKDNEGHGKTIRLGYETAIKLKYTWVFQTDSDGHFSPDDFYKLWKLRRTSPFILGFRENRDDTFLRRLLSKTIRVLLQLMFSVKVKDANIPFRLIKTSYLNEILPKVKQHVFAPNIYLSILAAKDKHKLHHIPVAHTNHNKIDSFKIYRGAFVGFFELLIFSINFL